MLSILFHALFDTQKGTREAKEMNSTFKCHSASRILTARHSWWQIARFFTTVVPLSD